MYSVYLIKEHRYAEKGDKFYYTNVAADIDLPTVELIESTILTEDKIKYYSTTKSLNGKSFEGVVVKYAGGSFKIINKEYDSKK